MKSIENRTFLCSLMHKDSSSKNLYLSADRKTIFIEDESGNKMSFQTGDETYRLGMQLIGTSFSVLTFKDE